MLKLRQHSSPACLEKEQEGRRRFRKTIYSYLFPSLPSSPAFFRSFTPQLSLLNPQSSFPALSRPASQNTSPVALANPLVTPINSQASSPSASICLALSPLQLQLILAHLNGSLATQTSSPFPSQKVIPDAHTKIVKGAGEAGELGAPARGIRSRGTRGERFSFFVVRENNQHRLLIWARIAAALISVLIGYAIYWQSSSKCRKFGAD